jgi:formyltetrahydrofolate synthetase
MTAIPTDIEIAQGATLRPITDVAADLGLAPTIIDLYGKYKAKLPLELVHASARGQAGARHGDQPDACRRGQERR